MRFNFSTQAKTETVNYMGGKAYSLTPEMELYSAVVTTMLSDSYYEKADQRLARIQSLVGQVNPAFVARLAVYTREQMYLRTAPVVLANELAKVHNSDGLVGRLVGRVVQRPDEITELLAYYQLMNQRTGTKKLNRISKQMQKGLATAFNKFDEYQFAKYNRETAVRLRDALFLVHPKAKDDAQQAVFDKIVSGTLNTPYTWETELSALGQAKFATEAEKAAAVRAKWEELVQSGRVGYMALLRNLRNIVTEGSDVALTIALTKLTDSDSVKRSRQLPFRFLSAYAEIEKLSATNIRFESTGAKISRTLRALETAITLSIDHLPVAAGKTVIASDNSGSMFGDAGGKSVVSAMSRRTTADIANLFAVLYWMKAQDTVIGLFGERLVVPLLNRTEGVFANFGRVNEAAKQCGGATEQGIFELIERLIQKREIVDRIVIFSDCQVGGQCNWYDRKGRVGNDFNRLFKQYRAINPNVKVFSIDLRGYGNTLFNDGVYTISGWSDKLFDLMVAVENGSTVVETIHKVNL